jgi:hypothetical protein
MRLRSYLPSSNQFAINLYADEIKYGRTGKTLMCIAVDPDPVGSVSFWLIRIGIQGLPIRSRIRIHFH